MEEVTRRAVGPAEPRSRVRFSKAALRSLNCFPLADSEPVIAVGTARTSFKKRPVVHGCQEDMDL